MKLSFFLIILNAFCAFGQVAGPPDVKFPDFKTPKSDSNVIFCSCDAQFPGGMKALKEHIYNYFTPLKNEEQEGQTVTKRGYVHFVVEADGCLMDIKILQGISTEIDELMLRLVEEMPRWIPACDCRGNTVRSGVRLPITFFFPKE